MAKKKKRRIKKKSGKKSFIILLIAFILITLSLFIYYYKFSVKKFESNEIPEGFLSFGYDISHHQGPINWETLLDSSNIEQFPDFIYIKATEGITFIDQEWKNNRQACLENNIPHGAYHFFNPKKLPIPQAEHFLTHYDVNEHDLPPVLDVEKDGFSDGDLVKKMEKWLQFVELKTGKRPIIYTYYNMYKKILKSNFPNYKFWVASYSKNKRKIMLNDPQIIHWQFSDIGKLRGHESHVDLNVSKISFEP